MTIRVAQWTIGNVGKVAARIIHQNPDYELVACYSRPGEKTGKDVGELCWFGKIGLNVVSTLEEVLAAKPDLVLYMPLMWDVDAMVKILEAGVDVISTANFITGYGYAPGSKERLHNAALRGGATLYGAGCNPGFASCMAVISTQASERVDKIILEESVDASGYNSPATWTALGFGGPKNAPGLMDRVRNRAAAFADSADMIAMVMGIELDDIVFEGDLGVATEDIDLGYMKIAKGMVCGMKVHYIGVKNGRRVIDVSSMTRVGQAMEPDWKPAHAYKVYIQGNPNLNVSFHLSPSADAPQDFSGVAASMPAINAIPAVVAAKPGLVTAGDIPMVVARGRLK